jgi:uncharacterized protein with PIN domain
MQLIQIYTQKDKKRLLNFWQIDGYYWVSGLNEEIVKCPQCNHSLYRTTYRFNRGDYNNPESHRHVLECRACGYMGIEIESNAE